MRSQKLKMVFRRPIMLLYRSWCKRFLQRFEHATRNCRQVQHDLLMRRIARGADTAFGRDHRFESIRTLADFRGRVPVSPYEYYEPYVERMKAGEANVLLRDKLVMFALTSGTQSARKFIPITKEYVKLFRHGWLVWGVSAAFAHSGLLRGKVVQLASNWDEFRTAGNIPCGSVSGLVARMQNPLVRGRYCVPPEVGQIQDVTARHYTTLRLAIPQAVTLMTTANPSTLANLARLGDRYKESLIRDIRDGTLTSSLPIPSQVRSALQPRIARPDVLRAQELEEIVSRTGRLLPKDYWPEMRLLGNWTGGAVGAYLRHFPELFGETPIRDIGLMASEGRMTIPVQSGTSAGVLDVATNYYEFIPEEEGDSDNPTILEAHELEVDRNYFILITTPSGFFRYNIYDVVRMVGWFNQTPMLEFLNKGSHVSSITGEKLSESQVSRAMASALADLSLALSAFTLAPCWDENLPYYVLLVERDEIPSNRQAQELRHRLERYLQQSNPEYASKRSSNRLGPLCVGLLEPGSWRDFFSKQLARSGGTVEQYKHPCLISDMDFLAKMPVEGKLVTAEEAA